MGIFYEMRQPPIGKRTAKWPKIDRLILGSWSGGGKNVREGEKKGLGGEERWWQVMLVVFYTIWGNKIEDMEKVEVGEFISER